VAVTYSSPSVGYNASNISYLGAETFTRTADGAGVGTETATQVRTTFATGIASGEGAAFATGLRTVLVYASGSGVSSEGVVDLYQGIRSATGGGGATAGDTAVGLRTTFSVASTSGAGASTVVFSRVALRQGVGTGLGSGFAVKRVTAIRDGYASAMIGHNYQALWRNGGKVLDLQVILPPRWSRRKPWTVPQ
jgi:hypothetical protein